MKMQAAEVLDLISLSLIRFSFMFKHLLDAPLTPRTQGFQPRPSCCFLRQGTSLSTFSLFIQVYKWAPATYSWGVTLRWTSILSRGEKQYF